MRYSSKVQKGKETLELTKALLVPFSKKLIIVPCLNCIEKSSLKSHIEKFQLTSYFAQLSRVERSCLESEITDIGVPKLVAMQIESDV